MLKIKEQILIFSTGHHITAQRGVVGISLGLEVFHGHTGVLVPSEPFLDDNDALSDLERTELADHMFGLWQSFKDRSLEPRCTEKDVKHSHYDDDF